MASIRMIVRGDAERKQGGDTLQAEATLTALRYSGHDATLDQYSPRWRPADVDIHHLFNIDRPIEFVHVAKLCRRANRSLVVSTIHHSDLAISNLRSAEYRRSKGTRRLLAKLPSWLREGLTYARRHHRVGDLAWLATALLRGWSTKRAVRRALLYDHVQIVALSEKEESWLRRDFSLPMDTRISIVPNGVDQSVDLQQPWPERSSTILCVGRIEPRKQQLEVAEAATRLNARVNFVGSASETAKGYVHAFTSALNNGELEWLGPMSHQEVMALMGRSRVLLNASWAEVQSLVELEAKNAGMWVVSNHESAADLPASEPLIEKQESVEHLLRRAMECSLSPSGPMRNSSHTVSWRDVADCLSAIYSEKVGQGAS